MGASETKGQRLTALCLLGFPLFNYPVLALSTCRRLRSASRCSTLGFS